MSARPSSSSTEGFDCSTSGHRRSPMRWALRKKARPRLERSAARPRLVIRMFGRTRPEHVGAALAAKDVDGRMVGLLRERQQRGDHRDHDALEAFPAAHADERDHGPARPVRRTARIARNSIGSISPPNTRPRPPPGPPAASGRSTGRAPAGRDRHRGGHQAGHLGSGAGFPVDCGLRGAAPAGIAPKSPPAAFASPTASNSRFGCGRTARACKRARRRDAP